MRALRCGGAALAVVLVLDGCAGTPSVEGPSGVSARPAVHLDGPPDAVPRAEPKSRSGNMESYQVRGKRYYTEATSRGHVERGVASWYGNPFHGRKTSSGEIYDMYQMTAAHKTLPLPTYARVTNLDNGATAVVKINDRGPFVGDRVIDLSYAAARRLGVLAKGTGHVEIVSVDPRDNYGVPPGMMLASSSVPAATAGQARFEAGVRPARRPQRAQAPALAAFGDGPDGRTRNTPKRSQSAPVLAARDAPTPARARATPAATPRGRSRQEAPVVARRAAPIPVPTVVASMAPASVVIAAADPLPPRPVVIASAGPIPMEPAQPAPQALPPAVVVAASPPPAAKPAVALAKPVVAAAPAKPIVVAAAATAKPAAKAAIDKGGKPGVQPAVFLQVGAFGDRNNAEALRKRLRSRFGEQVKVHAPGSGALYKVHLGPVTSPARADTLRRELKTLGLEAPIVIRQ